MFRKLYALLVGVSFAAAMMVSAKVLASVEPGAASLASQHSRWLGGKENADAIVSGLARGSSVMLMTRSDNVRSLAGFTPQAPLSDEQIEAALAGARETLDSLGIRQPSADQIQAALIGGEVSLPDGRTRHVQGSVGLPGQGGVSPVAAR